MCDSDVIFAFLRCFAAYFCCFFAAFFVIIFVIYDRFFDVFRLAVCKPYLFTTSLSALYAL